MKRTVIAIIAMLALVAASSLMGQAAQQSPGAKNPDKSAAASSEPSQLAKDLIGTWVLVGTPERVGEPPAAGGQLKFYTGRHWLITQADPNTGVVICHHGGTYTLTGDDYVETFEYANPSTLYLIHKTNRFKVKVEGDTLTQIGIGNPWTQVWKRAK
jgi:hypothetical protein